MRAGAARDRDARAQLSGHGHFRQGNEKTVEILGPRKSFGEAVLFLDRPYPVFAEALEDTLLLHIDRHVVFDLIEQNPAFSRSLLAGMAIRLHSMLRDVEDYSLHSGSQRLISYLFSLRAEDEAYRAAM